MRGALPAFALLLVACGSPKTPTPDGGLPVTPDCSGYTGGAFIVFEIVDERLVTWITDDAFIDEAARLFAAGEQRIPNFLNLHRGEQCDPLWSWHVDAAQVEWADLAIELCDGTPSMVEEDLDYWLGTVDQFCPWDARIVDLTDRR